MTIHLAKTTKEARLNWRNIEKEMEREGVVIPDNIDSYM